MQKEAARAWFFSEIFFNRFPIKRYGANNRNESEVKEEQQKQEIQHKASFLE